MTEIAISEFKAKCLALLANCHFMKTQPTA
jgi:hypothetical protein